MKTLRHFDKGPHLARSFAVHLRFYCSHHRTRGCRVTHMVGVPMIVAAFLIWPFSKKASLRLQFCGWFLQFFGHYFFEHNKPVLLEMRDPMTLVAALFFVGKEWQKFLIKR